MNKLYINFSIILVIFKIAKLIYIICNKNKRCLGIPNQNNAKKLLLKKIFVVYLMTLLLHVPYQKKNNKQNKNLKKITLP